LAWGRNGAASVAIASEALLMVVLAREANRRLGGLRFEWLRLARAAGAVVPAVIALIAVPAGDASVWVRIALGATMYLLGTVVFRAVHAAEIRRLFSPRDLQRDSARVVDAV
jgi:hypothetical protein